MAKLGGLLLVIALATTPATWAEASASGGPDTVEVQSGSLRLRALLWRPQGHGPFPAVLFDHGSGTTRDRELAQAATVGPVFARHGYLLLYVFRRGSGLSANQDTSAADLMARQLAVHGQEARNQLQIRLLETDHLSDALAGLAFLRALPEVDTLRLAVAGHSFGASLSLLVAEHDTTLRAAVLFSGSAASWELSPALRARLLEAVRRTSAPVFFIAAANDYSIAPAKALSAEMEQLHKPHRLKIYPPVGKSPEEGHDFVFRRVAQWEPDVFAFLEECMRR